jgi:hypothetical protein
MPRDTLDQWEEDRRETMDPDQEGVKKQGREAQNKAREKNWTPHNQQKPKPPKSHTPGRDHRKVGKKIAKKVAKAVPGLGTAISILSWTSDVEAKGLGYGTLNTTIDMIPVVGTVKGIIEIFAGDFISDKRPCP